MSKFLNELNIVKLKNINDLHISFDINKRVCAIFGENGCGKSTILYALSCIYQEDKLKNNQKIGENYTFSNFFLPTNYDIWNGSEFSIKFSEDNGYKTKVYKKEKRWTRYEDRPNREIYFCGLELCIPLIERETRNSKLTLNKSNQNDIVRDRILKDFSYVMNREYKKISSLTTSKLDKKYKLIETDRILYTNLFMGAGENKIIEILSIIHRAQKGALILIDELDLTLHTWALYKLLELIIKIANEKELQIIFTSHREEIIKFGFNIDIKYITNNFNPNKTECLNNINSDCLIELTGKAETKRIIYVEDNVSKAIILRFLIKNNIYEESEIKTYGAIDNAFTIACGLHLVDKNLFDKSIFILDGDKYVESEEKLEQIQKKMSGTESHRDADRQEVLDKIIQFQSTNVPQGTKKMNPEEFIFNTICNSNNDSEIKRILSRIKAVNDSHKLIPPDLLSLAVEKFSESPEWNQFTAELQNHIR